MGVRMKKAWDDGTRKLAAGEECHDFSPKFETRLLKSGLAEEISGPEGLANARARAGMAPLASPKGRVRRRARGRDAGSFG